MSDDARRQSDVIPKDDFPPVEVDRAELTRMLRDPAVTVVNALSREAFRAGHIPGSISLPLAEIPAHALRVLPDRSRTVVVYCAADT